MNKQQFATKSLRNATTRATKHLLKGDVEQAIKTLRDGCTTAESWMKGTHSQSHKASD